MPETETDLPPIDRPSPTSSRTVPKRSGVSRTWINFWLDAILLATFLVLLWAATVVRFVFPPGIHAAGWTLWGYSQTEWLEFQYGTLCALALGVLVHVMLHWTWVCGVVASRLGRKSKADDGVRTLYGVGLLIVALHLVGLGVAAAVLSIQPP